MKVYLQQNLSSHLILIRAMTEINTTITKRNEWIVISIKILFQQRELAWLVCGIVCDSLTMQWPRTSGGLDIFLNLPIKSSANVTKNDDSIRIFQWDGINEFITTNFMSNSLVDCQMVFLTIPCCIHNCL